MADDSCSSVLKTKEHYENMKFRSEELLALADTTDACDNPEAFKAIVHQGLLSSCGDDGMAMSAEECPGMAYEGSHHAQCKQIII